MRLFCALYPPPEVLNSALEAIEWLSEAEGSDSRSLVGWTPAELLHITAAFYGEVPEGAVIDLCAALVDVARDAYPMDLHLRGAGVFGDRVLWLGVGGDVEALRELSSRAARAGESVGLRLDRRPRQRAHLTVARARPIAHRGSRRTPDPAVEKLRRGAEALAVYAGPSWTAGELCLVESDLTNGRPVHTVFERFLFGGAEPGDGHSAAGSRSGRERKNRLP